MKDVTDIKFPDKRKDLDEFLFNLPYEIEYTPDTILDESTIKMRDEKDVPVLYSAIISDVDILITGDKDFNDVDVEKPEIMTVSEILEKY